MKILFFTIGNEEVASSRTRAYQYLPYLRQQGIKCRLIFFTAPWQAKKVINMAKESLFIKLCGKIYSFFKMVVFIISVPQYDILFIQRVLLPVIMQKFILLLNRNIVFDFDDAIYLADRWSNSFINTNKFLKRFQYILKKSGCVVVSNEVLKKVASEFNSNIIILSTPVDTQKLTPKSDRNCNRRVVIGWIGSPGTTKYIESLKKPLELLAEKFPFLKIKLVGSIPLQGWKINMFVKHWSLADEIKDLESFDIGIMPLTDDKWSKGKGGYKLLQYMAVGIPCVASPVGINKEIIEEGVTGFLATTPQDWIEKLSILIENGKLRNKMGTEGRKKAEAIYSYQANISKLVDIIASAKNKFRV